MQKHLAFLIRRGLLVLLLSLCFASLVHAETEKPLHTIEGASSIQLTVNEKFPLTYKAKSRIKYSVRDANIAQVVDGVLIGVRSGTTTLNVDALTSNSYRFTRLKVPVTVSHATQTIKLSKLPVIYNNTRTQMKISSRTSRTYTSSNPKVATVDASGVISAKSLGTTTITIKAKRTTKYESAVLSFKLTVKSKYKHVQTRSDTGKWLHTYSMKPNTTFEIPALVDDASRTFVGWATKPNATLAQVKYYPGDEIKVTSDIYIYAVYSKNSSITPVTPPSLSTSYQDIYIVGDSRAY